MRIQASDGSDIATTGGQLGALLQRRGVTLSCTALASGLAGEAVTAAPAGLTFSIAANAFGSLGSTGTNGLTAAKIAVATKAKVLILAAVLVVAAMTAFLSLDHSNPMSSAASRTALQQPGAPSANERPVPSAARRLFQMPSPNERPREAQIAVSQVTTPSIEPVSQPTMRTAAAADISNPESLGFSGTRLVTKPGGNRVRIEGTSNLHDWQVESPLIGGFLEVGPGFPLEPGQTVQPGRVQARAEVFIPVRSLKSLEKDGKPYSDKMDELMYESLREPAHRRILYHLSELFFQGVTNLEQGQLYEFESRGALAIGGVTNEIGMPVFVLPLGDGLLRILGRTSIKMSAFQIEPPAPNIGILVRTGDEVKILLDWLVAAKNETRNDASSTPRPQQSEASH